MKSLLIICLLSFILFGCDGKIKKVIPEPAYNVGEMVKFKISESILCIVKGKDYNYSDPDKENITWEYKLVCRSDNNYSDLFDKFAYEYELTQ